MFYVWTSMDSRGRTCCRISKSQMVGDRGHKSEELETDDKKRNLFLMYVDSILNRVIYHLRSEASVCDIL